MTPQEKAIELVDKFYLIEESQECDAWIDGYLAKKCALIAVDELLEECRLERDWYWEQVKTEIEKL
jgi:hypothetical protein